MIERVRQHRFLVICAAFPSVDSLTLSHPPSLQGCQVRKVGETENGSESGKKGKRTVGIKILNSCNPCNLPFRTQAWHLWQAHRRRSIMEICCTKNPDRPKGRRRRRSSSRRRRQIPHLHRQGRRPQRGAKCPHARARWPSSAIRIMPCSLTQMANENWTHGVRELGEILWVE